MKVQSKKDQKAEQPDESAASAIKAEDIRLLYSTSRRAGTQWSGLTVKERMKYFRQLRLLLAARMEEIADVICHDTGKVPVEAVTADIMPTLDALYHMEKHASKALAPRKVKTPIFLIGKSSRVEYMPRGVVLVISPWNYPFYLSMVPVLSALAGGNTVILKPSEVTPSVGAAMEELFRESGFPEGTVMVVHGGKEAGEALTEEGDPDYIFFTGSVRTGKIIQRTAAENLIPTTLELGGKDPMIVLEDAPLERAVQGALWGAFTNSGQVCMSTERLYVHEAIYDAFVDRLKQEAALLTRDGGPDADVGFMTQPAQKDIVRSHLLDALEKGAILQTGSHPDEWDAGLKLPLTIVTGITAEMDMCREETFGPVLPVIPFRTDLEAVDMANGTDYGLNASVWSANIKRARSIAGQLVSGSVVINDVIASIANHNLPFGGAKQSGIGSYHGIEGLRNFCLEKALLIDRGSRASEVQWFPYKGKYPLFLSLFKNYFGSNRNWFRFIKDYFHIMKQPKK